MAGTQGLGAAQSLLAGGTSLPSISAPATSGATGTAESAMYGNFGTGNFNVGGASLFSNPWVIGGALAAFALFVYSRRKK